MGRTMKKSGSGFAGPDSVNPQEQMEKLSGLVSQTPFKNRDKNDVRRENRQGVSCSVLNPT
jgi:hypothetical protein